MAKLMTKKEICQAMLDTLDRVCDEEFADLPDKEREFSKAKVLAATFGAQLVDHKTGEVVYDPRGEK